MPPKIKISREAIIQTALDIVRESGVDAVNARTIAARLNCSTQPIFSNFDSMEQLRLAVAVKANMLYETYMQQEMDSGKYPVYKASGMAYIRFAKEEKELFKFLYMCDTAAKNGPEISGFTEVQKAIVCDATGLDSSTAELFHLEMWTCTHGIATMYATGF